MRSRPPRSSSACPWCWSSPASAASPSSSSAAPQPCTRSAGGCSWLQVGDLRLQTPLWFHAVHFSLFQHNRVEMSAPSPSDYKNREEKLENLTTVCLFGVCGSSFNQLSSEGIKPFFKMCFFPPKSVKVDVILLVFCRNSRHASTKLWLMSQ